MIAIDRIASTFPLSTGYHDLFQYVLIRLELTDSNRFDALLERDRSIIPQKHRKNMRKHSICHHIKSHNFPE